MPDAVDVPPIGTVLRKRGVGFGINPVLIRRLTAATDGPRNAGVHPSWAYALNALVAELGGSAHSRRSRQHGIDFHGR